jgi:hypothetical protein
MVEAVLGFAHDVVEDHALWDSCTKGGFAEPNVTQAQCWCQHHDDSVQAWDHTSSCSSQGYVSQKVEGALEVAHNMQIKVYNSNAQKNVFDHHAPTVTIVEPRAGSA